MSKWTREQTIMLLELYKQYPHLYDNRNLCYSDRNERHNTLLIIAKKLEKIRPKTTVRDLKQKIRTIRTQYCVEKHKFHKSESKDFYSPRLWCFDSLKFLDNVVPYDNTTNGNISGYEDLAKHKLDHFASNQTNAFDLLEQHLSTDHEVEPMETTLSQHSQSLEPMNRNVSNEAMVSNLSQKFAEQITYDKKSRNRAFAQFICEELDSIKDDEILEDAKWDIQMTLRNALKKERRNNARQHSFQAIESRIILSPSPSQSSSSACFHNTDPIKQETSEDQQVFNQCLKVNTAGTTGHSRKSQST